MDQLDRDTVTEIDEGTGLQQGNDQNPPLQDVAAAFAKLPTKGYVRKLPIATADNLIGHVQGMALYQRRWVILTHDTVTGPGYFFVYDLRTGSHRTFPIRTPEGSRHPGGIQILGDYLVVGVEPSASVGVPSWVYFYDLTNIATRGPVLLPAPQIKNTTRGVACVGLTKISNFYLLATYSDGVVSFYQSNDKRLGDPALKFNTNPLFSFRPSANGKNVGYDNMGFVIDQRQNPYLIGLRGDEYENVIVDYGELWAIDPHARSARLVSSTHFYTETENTGQVGPHFRFGASVTVLGPTDLQLCCSSRSLIPVLPLHVQVLFNIVGNNGNW